MVQWRMDDRKSISVYGIRVAQSWFDLFFTNCLLHYETPRFDTIIEIGTGRGGGTLHLALNGGGAPVHSFDRREEPEHKSYQLLKDVLSITHYQGNVFSEDNKLIIQKLLKLGKVLLFCDGGNKVKEFNLFAPHLQNGSVIVAHDGGEEIHFEDVEETVNSNGLTPYNQDHSNGLHSRLLCFKKTM